MKHTPGPWSATDFGGNRVLIHAGNDQYAPGSRIAAISWGNGMWKPEYRENAHLIAAAPDLLEALDALMELERRGRLMPIGREWDAARAAIAKATGSAA